MTKISIMVLLVFSLGGCATQFGTRTIPAVHHSVAPPVVRHPIAVIPAPAPAPAAPETFRKRWLHKFFIKRATEK